MSRVEELRANLKRAKAMEELGIDVTKQIKALQDKKTFTRWIADPEGQGLVREARPASETI